VNRFENAGIPNRGKGAKMESMRSIIKKAWKRKNTSDSLEKFRPKPAEKRPL